MNNKPKYSEGTTRNQITNLLHVSSVLTPRTYALFGKRQQIANAMVKLKKEGVIEKSHNGEVFENFILSNYGDNLEEHFYGNIPDENIDYYAKYGMYDTKRAKYSKDNLAGNSRRIIRNGEITALMYAANIPTLPSDKKYVVQNKQLTDNVYYQSREIKYYSGYADDIDEVEGERTVIATRMNGTLLTAGGNYNIYHIGKDIQTWSAQGEYKIKNFVQNMLANYINKDNCLLNNAILFTYNLSAFLKLVNPSRKLRTRYDGLNMTYDKLYVLPYDINGKNMIKIMSEHDWEYRLKMLLTEEAPQDTSKLDVTCDYYDGETYTFIFCVPNMSRYFDFLHKAAFVNNKDKFQVVCFDYQLDFVKKSIGNHAKILTANFEDIFNEWNSN